MTLSHHPLPSPYSWPARQSAFSRSSSSASTAMTVPRHLTDTPRTHVEAATRRMLGVGVRHGNADSGEPGEE